MAEVSGTAQSRRWFKSPGLGRGLGLSLALLLAACGGMVPRRTAPPPPPPKPTQPVDQGSLPQDQARHRIALLVPLSGPNAAVGQSIANATALALADTGGKDLRITNYDTAPGAAAAAQRAIADGNRLFLGPLLGDDVRVVAGAAAAAKIPVVSFSNDASAAGDNVWLLGFSPSQSVERVVRYAKARGLTQIAALIPPGQYGRNAASTLIRVAEAADVRVVAMQSYTRTQKSIAAAVAALSKQKYDAVLIADGGRNAVTLVPAIRRSGGQGARILGPELWAAEPGLNNVAAMSGAWYASVDDAMFDQLTQRYRARYGRTPYRLASLGYDAVLLTARIARDWKPGTPFPVDKLSDDSGFAGVDGAFRFGRGRVAERALAVHQLGSGGASVVSPAPKAF